MPINDYWNPDEYRERLRQTVSGRALPGQVPTGQPGQGPALAPAAPTAVTDTNSVLGQQFGQPVRGAALQPAARRQPQQATQQPVFGGPFGQQGLPQSQQKQKIPTAPPDWQPKVDEEKLKTAKNFPEVMDAMDRSSQTEYMDWWEKQYGSINAKWNKVQEDIGDRPDPRRKLSRRDKFDMLMEFGLNLMRASSPQESGGDTTTALTSAFHDTVRGQQASRYGEQVAYNQALAGAEAGRAKELETIGTRGAALKESTGIANTESQMASRAGRGNEVIGVEDTKSGLMGRTRGGALQALRDPISGDVAQRDPKARGAGAETTYRQQRTDLVDMYEAQGMSRQEAESQATKEMNAKRTGKTKTLRDIAEERVNTMLKGSKDWQGVDNDSRVPVKDREKVKGELLEAERRKTIKGTLGIDLDKAQPRYGSLRQAAGMEAPSAVTAPPEDEADLRARPELAQDFFEEYGYLPDWFWPQ